MTAIICTDRTLAQTISILQIAGDRLEERVVLWLASASSVREPIVITEVHEPQQITDIDFFKIPPESMRALMAYLRASRLKIVAQVHSHPGKAFHSKADDKWAIVRHLGALSIVLPKFARNTTPKNFCEQAKTYELSPENAWVHVANVGPEGRLGVIP
jgi:proteasome lid subunit RPN8/RPN11